MDMCNFEEFRKKNDIYNAMYNSIKKKRLVPVIGSGVSCGLKSKVSRVPNVSELKKKMIDMILSVDNELAREDIENEELGEISETLAQYVTSQGNEYLMDDFANYVCERFCGVHDIPQHIIEFLRCDWKYIYTLNYDDMIESCLKNYEVFVPYREISNRVREKPHIIKLHGDAHRFYLERNFEYLVLSTSSYLKSMSHPSNRTMSNWLIEDCTSNDFLFLGCGLKNEFDILYAQNGAGKSCEDSNSFYIYCTEDYDSKIKKNEINKLSRYNIKYAIQVKKEDMSDFYSFIIDIVKNINCINAEDEFDNYKNYSIRQLGYTDNQNTTYFFNNKLLFKNKEIVLPYFFIERDVVAKIKKSISENIPITILYGPNFSGKTYALIQVLKEIGNTYEEIYFFKDKVIGNMGFNSLLKKKNIVAIFDAGVLNVDDFKEFCQKNISILQQQHNRIVVAVNVSDKDYENTYFISRMTDSISLVGIQNTLSETELKSFNEKCTKLNIIERRNKNTFLDYAFRLEKYILEDDDCKTILPDTNIIPKNDRGFLTCMILLANNNVITNEMAVDFDIIDILAILCKKYRIAVQKSYFLQFEQEKSSHSNCKYILNSAYWVYRCLSQYALRRDSYNNIILAISDIIAKYKKLTRRRAQLNKKIKPYYYLDRIQEVFFCEGNDRGSLQLPSMLYNNLIRDVLSDDFNALHQSAKCSLRKARIESTDNEKKEILQQALLSIQRAIDKCEENSYYNMICHTLAHMKVTKLLILINIWRIKSLKEKYSIQVINAAYDVFVINEKLLYPFIKEIKNETEISVFINEITTDSSIILDNNLKKQAIDIVNMFLRCSS